MTTKWHIRFVPEKRGKMRKLKFVKGGGADRGRISVEKFFSKKWLFRGNFMREIDCAHLKILKKLFRGSKIEKNAILYRCKKSGKNGHFGDIFSGLKNTLFCHLKIFRRRIRVFQLFLPLEMMFLEKKFFWKNAPKNDHFCHFFAKTQFFDP